MKVGAAIYSMLKDDSAVSALVGTRIYPELAEEGAATPYVVYSVVSNTPVDTKDSAPVDESQLEVFSVADTYAAANDLADKVRTALARQEKVVYDTVTVQSIKYTNEVTEVSAERNLFISVQDYTARTVGVIARPSFLFDSYGGALGAYSLRQLNASYTGAAVTVRRESDNATKDIGFDVYGNLQQGELEAFCAGTNGFVSVWADQSGNGNDATQTTPSLQPQIVSNGAVYLTNGKPSIHFNDVEMNIPGLISQLRLDIYVAYKTSDPRYILFNEGLPGNRYSWVVEQNSSITGIIGNLQYDYVQGENSVELYRNGAEITVDGSTTRDDLYNALVDGVLGLELNQNVRTDEWANFELSGYTGRLLDGYVSELVVYNSDQSANRTGIESNINTHYSIY
jgi:hypothetical protein